MNELSSLLMRIREAGCHNINFVTPEPWIPLIVPAVHLAKKRGLDIPVVWNTSGFISRTGFELIQDIVDIFLTDIRYKDPEEASRLSGQVSYFYHCRESALWMLQSAGHFMMKPGGIGKRGVIARILILPGMVQSAVSCLDFVARVMSTETYISLMSQFEPVYRDPDPPLPHRGVTRRELNEIREYAETLGLNYGWRQDIDSAPSELLGIHMKCTERVRELPFSNTSPPEKAKRSQADLHL